MEGGNEATEGSGITQFAEGEPKSSSDVGSVISFANAHSITAFHHSLLSKKGHNGR